MHKKEMLYAVEVWKDGGWQRAVSWLMTAGIAAKMLTHLVLDCGYNARRVTAACVWPL